MRIKFRSTGNFRAASLEESNCELHNPGCGWYHIYTFKVQPSSESSPVETQIWMDEEAREEQLALVLIDIGAFRVGAITAEALCRISEILEFFHRNRKQMILRFVYDREGKGRLKEPLTLSTVKWHMGQVGELIRRYREDILVLQGIFVGNWGEMHGSKFLDDSSMCELVNTLYRVTEGACFLAVRTPAQWRRIVGSKRVEAGVKERLALFNDGMFGSVTDLGTYGVGAIDCGGGILDRIGKNAADWEEKRSRQEELEWQRRQLYFVPNGGETVAAVVPTVYRQAVKEMYQMHVSYLNCIYHPDQLGYWKRERVGEAGCWNGLSGYDYIGRHLGYRFVVRDVAEGKGRELYLKIENCGFGNLCQEADCFLEIEEAGGTVIKRRLDTDPRKWMSEETILLPTGISLKEKRMGGSRVYLILRRRADGGSILFANQGAGEKLQVGEFIDFQEG